MRETLEPEESSASGGFAAARGELLATVNDDAVVEPGWRASLAAAVAAELGGWIGDEPFLAKPCSIEELTARIEQELG